MPNVFGYHDVKDKDHWLASPKRESSGPLGITNIRTFVDPENPTRSAADGRPRHRRLDACDADRILRPRRWRTTGCLPETLVILVEA